MISLFAVHIAIYSIFPFYFATLDRPLRRASFYIYLSIVLLIGGFLGSVYSLPISDGINISGGNMAYGALMMTSIIFVLIERDILILRNILRLVIVVNIFKILMFTTILASLENDAVLNPNMTSSNLFKTSILFVILGGTLIISELTAILFIFEKLKKLSISPVLNLSIYIIIFIAILCLDGILFPLIAFGINDKVISIVIGGLNGKFIMASSYSLSIIIFFIVFKHKLSDYIETPTFVWKLLLSSTKKLLEETMVREEKLRLAASVYENTKDAIMVTDTNHNIISVNKAFTEILGYHEKEAIGKNPRMIKSGQQSNSFYQEMFQSLYDTGSWNGEIWNRGKNGKIIPVWENISSVNDEHGELSHFVAIFSDISSIKKSQEQLEYIAHHDPLTKLPNRLLLDERLKQSIKQASRIEKSLAVIFLDLDHFKHINDSFGHPLGDELLKQVSDRILHTLRGTDTIARVGGDEFIIILENIDKYENVGLTTEKLITSFELPFQLSTNEISISASLGISLYPHDGKTAEELLRNADSAMYKAKEAGRNTFQFYTKKMTDEAYERVTIENEIRQALVNKEFILNYQPQWNLATHQLIGLEALIRWNHPEKGLIPPSKFIPVAEDSGLILQIDKWVINQACQQTKAWIESGLYNGQIAINISGIQFNRGDLQKDVKQALEKSQLPVSFLELEITEGYLMNNISKSIDQLKALKSLGVTISIDDFGTGYSSLSYLKQLPIQKLKIDQSFIRDIPSDPNDMAIANAILALGKSLDLRVIAEGVETEAQSKFLADNGCPEVQGYLYSRPLSTDKVDELLERLNDK